MDASPLGRLPGELRNKIYAQAAQADGFGCGYDVRSKTAKSTIMVIDLSKRNGFFTGSDGLLEACTELRTEYLSFLKVKCLRIIACDDSKAIDTSWLDKLRSILERLHIGQHKGTLRIEVLCGHAVGPQAISAHLRDLGSSIDWTAIDALRASQTSTIVLSLHTKIDSYPSGSDFSTPTVLGFIAPGYQEFNNHALAASRQAIRGRIQNATDTEAMRSHALASSALATCQVEFASMEFRKLEHLRLLQLAQIPASDKARINKFRGELLSFRQKRQKFDRDMRYSARQWRQLHA